MESENVTGGEVLGRSSAFMPGAIDQRALMGKEELLLAFIQRNCQKMVV